VAGTRGGGIGYVAPVIDIASGFRTTGNPHAEVRPLAIRGSRFLRASFRARLPPPPSTHPLPPPRQGFGSLPRPANGRRPIWSADPLLAPPLPPLVHASLLHPSTSISDALRLSSVPPTPP
jgi:hypothetical protein